MPVDPFWEGIHLASVFEFIKRTRKRYSDRPHGVFDPGEIAHVSGSLTATFYEFVKDRGLKLFPQERKLVTLASEIPDRYCLVLDRHGDGKYTVCYLTTFGGATRGKYITSPIGQFFGLALGKTAEWPTGIKSVQTTPPWDGPAYLFMVPVVHKGLDAPRMVKRFILEPGELERVRRMVDDKIQSFGLHHEELRRKQIQWGFSRRRTFQGNIADISASNGHMVEMNALDVTEGRSDMMVEMVHRKMPEKFGQLSRRFGVRNDNGFHTPHWLTPPSHCNNGRWLMRYMLEDVTQSSRYLNSPIRSGRRHPLLQTLPSPFYAPSLRVGALVVTKLIR